MNKSDTNTIDPFEDFLNMVDTFIKKHEDIEDVSVVYAYDSIMKVTITLPDGDPIVREVFCGYFQKQHPYDFVTESKDFEARKKEMEDANGSKN